MSNQSEVLGYRLKLEKEEMVADFVFDCPFHVFGFVILTSRKMWDGAKIHSYMGSPIGLRWTVNPFPVYHPLCIDSSFTAINTDTSKPIFHGSIRSCKVYPIEGRFRALAAFDEYRTEIFEKGVRRFAKLVHEWSEGDPDAARVLTIFASQHPSHPFWKVATGRS